MNDSQDTSEEHKKGALPALALAALGVVYGDIGTSPLYAIRESVNEYAGIEANTVSIMGILSLIFWSLIIIISFKYVWLVMKADNNGEGGIIALTALISPPGDEAPRGSRRWVFMLLGLFGAALLWGDSMITPAISVVSAVEGLGVATHVFEPYIIPITIGILIALFLIQKRGTEGVGKIFGPVTGVWFLVLGFTGAYQIVANPEILAAVNPAHALTFFEQNGLQGGLVLGSVFLVVTGGEALYADIGHFGTLPIRLTWFGLVLPCLLLNYFGQGALILDNLNNPEVLEQPFFHMTNWLPHWVLYAQVALATAATIIASQAVISGAFSLTRQAVQLGYLPRLTVEHTSEEKAGQIYLPFVNMALMVACILLVVGFSPYVIGGSKTSSNLAAAYGVAVTTDMVFTTVLFAVVARLRWKWSAGLLGLLVTGLLTIELGFWGAMVPKIPEGGWVPLVLAAVFFLVMTTWKRGRGILVERLDEMVTHADELLAEIDQLDPVRVDGTAVYMSSNPEGTPQALSHNLEHQHSIHERIVILTVVTSDQPYCHDDQRCSVEKLSDGIFRVIATYGFAESPDISDLLEEFEIEGVGFDLSDTTFFLGRENLIATDRPGMAQWRERLFARISRNARRATSYFGLPSDRVVEIGVQIEL